MKRLFSGRATGSALLILANLVPVFPAFAEIDHVSLRPASPAAGLPSNQNRPTLGACSAAPSANLQRFTTSFLTIRSFGFLPPPREASLCMATLVAKQIISGDQCEYALATAAHCITPETSPRRGATTLVKTNFGDIPADANSITFPQDYFNSSSNENSGADAAVIRFRSSCQVAADSLVIPLADQSPQSNTRARVMTQPNFVNAPNNRRPGFTDVTLTNASGSSRNIQGSMQPDAVLGGDSGAAVLQDNRLIGMLSTVTVRRSFLQRTLNLVRGPATEMQFSRNGINYVRRTLAACYPGARNITNLQPQPNGGVPSGALGSVQSSTPPFAPNPVTNLPQQPTTPLGNGLRSGPQGLEGKLNNNSWATIRIDRVTGQLIPPSNDTAFSEATRNTLRSHYQNPASVSGFTPAQREFSNAFLDSFPSSQTNEFSNIRVVQNRLEGKIQGGMWAPLFLRPNGTLLAGQNGSQGSFTNETRNELRKFYRRRYTTLSNSEKAAVYPFLRSFFHPVQPGQPEPSIQPGQPTPGQTGNLTAAQRQAIHHYENELNDRGNYPAGLFRDVPQRGNGRLILAYFGTPRPELDQQIAAAGLTGLVEARNYPMGSPEQRHAQLFGTSALGIDGLGRKVTRYRMDPAAALASLANRNEVQALRNFLSARNALRNPPLATQPVPPTQSPPPIQPGHSPVVVAPRPHTPVNQTALRELLQNRCVSCHTNRGVGENTPERLIQSIPYMDQQRLNTMMDRASLPPNERTLLLNHYQNELSRLQSSSTAVTPTQNHSGRLNTSLACYSDGRAGDLLRRLSPQSLRGDTAQAASLANALRTGQIIPYTDRDLPLVYQAPQFTRMELGNPYRDGSTLRFGYYNHGNMEFPWRSPAGMDTTTNSRSTKFIIPPPNSNGKIGRYRLIPNDRSVRGIFGRSVNLTAPIHWWDFYAGTTFGEILDVIDPVTQEAVPFEIRMRTKLPNGSWKMDVLRPFENPQDLAGSLRTALNRPELASFRNNPQVTQFLTSMDSPAPTLQHPDRYLRPSVGGRPLNPRLLSSTAETALQSSAQVHELPPLPRELVSYLLKNTPFKSVFGKPWIPAQNGSPAGWSPSSQSNFNIVPRNYAGPFLPTTEESCMKCHESAGRHVDNFDPRTRFGNLDGRNRSWYDHIRGADRILSWHPFNRGMGQLNNPRNDGPSVLSTVRMDPCASRLIDGLPSL